MLSNRYKLLETIGAGGMAVVYRAQDMMLERPVAIKLLRPKYSGNQAFRNQFKQEAKKAANLSHQNIVTVFDFGYDAGRLFIVMEQILGIDLKTMIRQRGVFPISEAINLIVQACAGIGYAHRAGIIHCDVKPHNMLVTSDHRLKVTDFGIAQAFSTINPDEKSDEVWGSPQYFSPEQAAGYAPVHASDVYSLGVVLYEMLTGQLPFTSNDPQELARLHREKAPVPPRRFNQEIPVDLERIILKVLSKEPSQRYRTADQLRQVLMPFTYSGDPVPFVQRNSEPLRQEAPVSQSFTPSSMRAQATPSRPISLPPQPSQAARAPSNSIFPAYFTPDIIALLIITIILWVGLVPFMAYVFLRLGWIS